MLEIISTIGQTTCNYENLEGMYNSGSTIFRINLAQGLADEIMHERFNTLQKFSAKNNVDIMADLPYPGCKIRLGEFPEYQYYINEGSQFILIASEKADEWGKFIPVQLGNIQQYCHVGKIITIGDGELAFKVTRLIGKDQVEIESVTSGTISCYKAIHLDQAQQQPPEKIISILKMLSLYKPSMLALSFTESNYQLEKLATIANPIFELYDWYPKIFAKIENRVGVDNLDEIINNSDGIIVARGDLGLNIPYDELGIIQKQIIHKCRIQNKPVFVASQIIESLIDSFIPKRSEILDLTNIVLDHASGILLAKETSSNNKAAHIVKQVNQIINKTLVYRDRHIHEVIVS